MNAKIFSYKVEGVSLKEQSALLKLSEVFDKKLVLAEVKKIFESTQYIVDETSLNYKLIDDQLHVQGFVVEKEEPKVVGFQFGK